MIEINVTLPQGLPSPSAEALAHSAQVSACLRAEIEQAGGRLSFARYMELALYAPGLGYYSAGLRKFGAAGDFVTAPEISPLFSRCLARQCLDIMAQLDTAEILEFGAGSGVMAAEILRELEAQRRLPEHYYILELSAELRQRQQHTVQRLVPHLAERVHWLEALPAPGWRGIILANEVLDAMPVHRFHLNATALQEWYVTYGAEGFVWQLGALSDARLEAPLRDLQQRLPQEVLQAGYTSEINLAAQAWLRSLAAFLEQGIILIIDYGFPAREYYHPERREGTLMCHYRHYAHADPLILPGLQDITAHVDFTALASTAIDAGLSLAGYTTQAYFLLATGLMDMAAPAGADPHESWRRAQHIKKLTLPHEMGELFKVMALSQGLTGALQGFSLYDLRAKL